MIEQKQKKLEKRLSVIMGHIPGIDWLVRAFDTYDEAKVYHIAIEELNLKLFNYEHPMFGRKNPLDPDMNVDDGEPDYFVMEVPYAP